MRHLKLFIILAFIFVGCSDRADWKPPKHPSSNWILMTAKVDVFRHHYQSATAKHVWFFHHSIKNDPAMAGVRLSFALADWRELADKYPPAMTALLAARDEALDSLLMGNAPDDAFRDYMSLNDHLDQQDRTRDTFLTLDQTDTLRAARVFKVARPVLIQSRHYALCGRYLHPMQDLAYAIELYRSNAEAAAYMERKPEIIPLQRGLSSRMRKLAESKLEEDVGTLIALLVINQRIPEAQVMAAQARPAFNDSTYHAVIDSAMQGVLPPLAHW